MKYLYTVPYKILATILVGTAILLMAVMAVGVPANILSHFN